MQVHRRNRPWLLILFAFLSAVVGVGLIVVNIQRNTASPDTVESHAGELVARHADGDSAVQNGALTRIPFQKRSQHDGPRFARLESHQTRIEFNNVLNDEQIWSGDFRTVLNGSFGSGTCVGDFDNDGRADIYLVGRESPNKLFRQVSDWRFEDVTSAAGVDGGQGTCAGATFVDIDDDGDLDLYLCKYDAPNCLYANQGNGTFVESAATFGLDFRGASVMAAFHDFDRDGDLDLYLLTNRLFISDREMQRAKSKIQAVAGRPVVPDDVQEIMYFSEQRNAAGQTQFVAVPAGQRDRLFRNEGDGTFHDVTTAAGLHGCYRGHSAMWWDCDGDNWPDLDVGGEVLRHGQ